MSSSLRTQASSTLAGFPCPSDVLPDVEKHPAWHINHQAQAHSNLVVCPAAGKTSVVSGSNSGIGVETVRALASAGSRVILTSRSMAAGEAVAKDIKASGVKVHRRCR